MSRLRKSVVPFSWNTITANFTQGTSASVNLASFLRNTQGLTITYSVIGSLPSGVTLSGAALSYDGAGAAGTASVQFRAVSGAFTAESSATTVQVVAVTTGNLAPLWQGSDPIALGDYTQGGAVSLIGYVSDIDGPLPLTFGRTGGANDTAPGSITLNSSGTLTIPSGLPEGTYTVEVFAEDGFGLVPQVTGVTLSSVAYNSIQIAWDETDYVANYQIERSLDGTSWTLIQTLGASVGVYVDTTVSASTQYFYRVRGVNDQGAGQWSDTETATTPAAPVVDPGGDRVEFADIPEIVFLEGFAETEELGIFILDPTNRTRPGDLSHLVSNGARIQRHPDDGGGNYAPRSGVTWTSVSGSAEGVEYNPSTGQLSYDGSTQASQNSRWTVKLSFGTKEKRFDVRVMRPRAVLVRNTSDLVRIPSAWNGVPVHNIETGGLPSALTTAMSSTDGVENVVAILGGTYTDQNWTASTAKPIVYILGEPYNRPYWNCATTSDTIGQQDCRIGYAKNLKVTNSKITFPASDAQILSPTGVTTTIYNCEVVDGSRSMNSLEVSDNGFAQPKYAVGPYKFHVVNLFARKPASGNGGTMHLMYIHGRPNAYLNVINAKIYGARNATQIKTVMTNVYVLNTYMHTLTVTAAQPDGNYPAPSSTDLTDDTSRAAQMFNPCSVSDVVFYNNDCTLAYNSTQNGVQTGALYIQTRTYQVVDSDSPPAPDYSFIRYSRYGDALPTTYLSGCGYGLTTGTLPPMNVIGVESYVSSGGTQRTEVTFDQTHDLSQTDDVIFSGFTSPWSALNGSRSVQDVRATNKASFNVNSSTFTPWVSGGSGYASFNIPIGGSPAYVDYPTPIPQLNGWPNTPNTFLDPDFWDEIRTYGGAASVDAALADPDNPYTYKRFISHCRFTWLQQGSESRREWMRDEGQCAGGNYSTTGTFKGFLLPTTQNWTHRSANFVLNCTWNGWTDTDVSADPQERWQAVYNAEYYDSLAEADLSRTQLYGPFGTITRLPTGFVDLDNLPTGQTITVNGKDVDVGVTPYAESSRPRPVVHVGGGTGPTAVTDPAGRASVPSWFKIGATG